MTDIVMYLPVLHRGYLEFLKRQSAVTRPRIYLLSDRVSRELRSIQKDIRALTVYEASAALSALGYSTVQIGSEQALAALDRQRSSVVMPDEDITRLVARQYLPNCEITFDPTFLRWNEGNVTAERPVIPDAVLSKPGLAAAYQAAAQSSDWWRWVGAAVYRGGQLLLCSYNHHLPTEYEPYFSGDVRAVFKKGINVDLLTAIHAEQALIGDAARQGLRLEGATLYVTTFPCPSCAKLVAASGIAELVYAEGYAMLDGETVLRQAGVRITQVQ